MRRLFYSGELGRQTVFFGLVESRGVRCRKKIQAALGKETGDSPHANSPAVRPKRKWGAIRPIAPHLDYPRTSSLPATASAVSIAATAAALTIAVFHWLGFIDSQLTSVELRAV